VPAQSCLEYKFIIEKLKVKQNEPFLLKQKKILLLKDFVQKYQNEECLKEIIHCTKKPQKQLKIEAIKALGECMYLKSEGKNEHSQQHINMVLQVLLDQLKG